MGKFDKYGDGHRHVLPGAGRATQTSATTHSAEALIAQAQREAKMGDADRIIYGKSARIAVALDATGSMAGLLAAAKSSVGQIITRASREAGFPIEIEIIVYRDYDVPQSVMQRSGATTDTEKLVTWLSKITADGGGANGGEAVEAALQAILEDGQFAAVLLAGDEPSNSRENLTAAGQNGKTSIEIARALHEKGVPIHSFVIDDDPRTVSDFRNLSDITCGKSGRLDGSAEMIDLAVLAILSSVKGASSVRRYMETTRLSNNARDFGQLLLGTQK